MSDTSDTLLYIMTDKNTYIPISDYYIQLDESTIYQIDKTNTVVQMVDGGYTDYGYADTEREVLIVSDYVFPTLKGLTYPIKKSPKWNTLQNRSISGLPKYFQLYTYPFYDLKLQFSYLEDENSEEDDIHTLMSFYNQVGGAGQDFLFGDPLFEVNTVTNQTFGVGDGVHTSFRLARTYGNYTEPVFGIASAPIIYSTINGTTTTLTVNTDYTWNKKALITFTTAPANGAVLSWSGTWYYRCHFKNDDEEFQQIFYGGWDLEELELESMKLE